MTQPSSKNIPSSARVAKLLGQLSLVAVVLSLLIGFMVEMIGVNSLFFSFAIPLSLAAIIVSTIVRRDLGGPEGPGYKEAVSGQRMGLVALGAFLCYYGCCVLRLGILGKMKDTFLKTMEDY